MQARKRPASKARPSRRARHSLIAMSALASLAGGAALAAIGAIDVSPSAASIPTVSARLDAGFDFGSRKTVKEAVTEIVRQEAEPAAPAGEPAFRAASMDGQRLVMTARPLHSGEFAATARLMLTTAQAPANADSYRFLPSEMVAEDPDGFRPVLLASLAPTLDGERFAEPVQAYASLGQSLFDSLTLGEVDASDLAPLTLASLDLGMDETASPAEPLPEEAPAAQAPAVKEQVEQSPARGRPIRRLGPDGRPMSTASTALAYAPDADPDEDRGGAFSGFKKLFINPMGLPGPGSGIAVYDIRNSVVYMPNGQKLEAHSGLGKMKDNPKYAHVKMKGPTPPNIYNLRMREALFHGVEAVRMLPTDHAKMRGRNGILAHTYMLRGTNGSNGCLSFKHYDKFLTAFKRGEVEKIIVVPDMTHLPTYMASL